MIELNDRSFDGFIEEGMSLVMMSASWCKRCLAGERMLDEISKRFPALKTAKIDLQKNGKILMRYAPNGIPHFILFKDGSEVLRHTGVDPEVFMDFLKGGK